MSELQQLLRQKKVIVTLGPGGVGKTTSSIGIAILGAHLGLRVGLLSIDPAKRLASALGMSLDGSLKPITFSSPIKLSGSIDAAMLDQKAVFDDMVRKYSKDPATTQKILNHSLYIAASTKLAGPLEYMALAKLHEMSENNQYDLIVLDTPPDTQALDFLKRPNLLAGFLENKVMTWLVKPFYLANKFGGKTFFSMGEKLTGGIAKVTGAKALTLLAEFLVLLQDVIDGFHLSGEKIVTLLSSQQTGFVVVSTPTHAAARSAKNLVKQVQELGYSFEMLFINRCVPEIVKNELYDPCHQDIILQSLLLSNCKLRIEGEKQLIEQLSSFVKPGIKVVKIAEREAELHTAEAIYDFAMSL